MEALGVGEQLAHVVVFVGVAAGDVVLDGLEPARVDVDRTVGGQTDVLFIALGDQLGTQVIGVEVAGILLQAEAQRGVGAQALAEVLAPEGLRIEALVVGVGFVEAGGVVGVVGGQVEDAAFLAQAEAARGSRLVGVRIGFHPDGERLAAGLRVDDHRAGSQVAVLGRGDAADHFNRFDVVGGNAAGVDTLLGNAHATRNRRRKGLHVGVGRYRSAVYDDGGTQTVHIGTVRGAAAHAVKGGADVELLGRGEDRIGQGSARQEGHQVGQRTGLHVVHGLARDG